MLVYGLYVSMANDVEALWRGQNIGWGVIVRDLSRHLSEPDLGFEA